MAVNRAPATTTKVSTPFGNLYVHVHFDVKGKAIGAALSYPWKNPDAQVDRLIEAISEGLNKALLEEGR